MEESISIRLGQLARKLNLSKSEIVRIFKDMGIHIHHNSSYRVSLDQIKLLTEMLNATHDDFHVSSPENFSRLLSKNQDVQKSQKDNLDSKSSSDPFIRDQFVNSTSNKENIYFEKDISRKALVNEKRYLNYYFGIKEAKEVNKLLVFFKFLHKDLNSKNLDQSKIDFEYLLQRIQPTLFRKSNQKWVERTLALFKQKEITYKILDQIAIILANNQKDVSAEILKLVDKKVKNINESYRYEKCMLISPKVIKKDLEELRKIIIGKSGYFIDNPSFKSESEEMLSKPKFTITKANDKVYSGIFIFDSKKGENEEDPLHRK